jgi:hypothetical protein
MSAVLSRESLRARINLMEALESVIGAIEELQAANLGNDAQVTVAVAEGRGQRLAVTSAYAVPVAVTLVGYRAMQAVLESMLKEQAE